MDFSFGVSLQLLCLRILSARPPVTYVSFGTKSASFGKLITTNGNDKIRLHVVNSKENSTAEAQFRITGRWILILLALFLPVLFAGFGLNELFRSDVPVTACAASFLAALIYISVRRFIAYYQWTGKYPFSWLYK